MQETSQDHRVGRLFSQICSLNTVNRWRCNETSKISISKQQYTRERRLNPFVAELHAIHWIGETNIDKVIIVLR